MQLPPFSQAKTVSGVVDGSAPNTPDRSMYLDQDMILRDYLATDRTAMSNEQSLLSYVRTALAMAAGGGALIHWQADVFIRASGGLLLGASFVLMITGIRRFRQVHSILRRLRQTARPREIPREGERLP